MQEQDSHSTEEAKSPASSSKMPTKSKVILALGLLSVLSVPVILVMLLASGVFFFVGGIIWLAALVLAFTAVIMGSKELDRIHKGIIEATQRRSTVTGMSLGGIGSVLLILGVPILLSMVSESEVSSFYKDPLILGLNEVAADAYQYRLRATESKGGQRSYQGYIIPPKLSKSDFGTFSSLILHADTVQLRATSIHDSTLIIIVKIGPDGHAIDDTWIYLGNFE